MRGCVCVRVCVSVCRDNDFLFQKEQYSVTHID